MKSIILVSFLLITTLCSAQSTSALVEAANSGDAMAQYQLGKEYLSGKNIHEDKNLAFEWFEKSAFQDFDSAQFALGECYYLGRGTKKDKSQAFKWYEKSSDLGNGEAQYALGVMHYKGEETLVDRKMSAYYIRLAFENGNKKAIKFWNKRKLWKYEE